MVEIVKIKNGNNERQFLKMFPAPVIQVKMLDCEFITDHELFYYPAIQRFFTRTTCKRYKEKYPYEIITTKRLKLSNKYSIPMEKALRLMNDDSC